MMSHWHRGYTTNILLQVLQHENGVLTYSHNWGLLNSDHSSSLRLVISQHSVWKSTKWMSGVEFKCVILQKYGKRKAVI